jgi:hypothetical protein
MPPLVRHVPVKTTTCSRAWQPGWRGCKKAPLDILGERILLGSRARAGIPGRGASEARIEGWLVSMLAWQGLAGHLLAHRMVSVEPVTVLGRPIGAPDLSRADDEQAPPRSRTRHRVRMPLASFRNELFDIEQPH